jgi:hypothetical protein
MIDFQEDLQDIVNGHSSAEYSTVQLSMKSDTAGILSLNNLVLTCFSPVILFECEFLNSRSAGFVAEGTTEAILENCTFANALSNRYDTTCSGSAKVTLLNTTHAADNLYVEDDAQIRVEWFMHVHVVLPDLSPLESSYIEIHDVYDFLLHSGITSSDGTVQWVKCLSNVITAGGTQSYTPHNVSATIWSLQGWALPEPFMDSSKDVYVVMGGNGYNINLHQGWNLISLPFEPYDMSSENIPEVLKSIEGKWDVLRSWDNQVKTWLSYKPGYTSSFTHVNQTMGLWIYINTPCTLVAMGNPQPMTEIQLYTGWNLVGYPSATPRTFTDALAGTYADMVSVYDGTVPEMIRDIPMPSDEMMSRGNGYWVRVTEDCVWTVNC